MKQNRKEKLQVRSGSFTFINSTATGSYVERAGMNPDPVRVHVTFDSVPITYKRGDDFYYKINKRLSGEAKLPEAQTAGVSIDEASGSGSR